MKVLLIDINESRANKIEPILMWAGMEMIQCSNRDADIYALVAELHPEIILVDTNSASRDTLEHLAQRDKASPRTVINLGQTRSEGINRLAAEVGISLYAIDALPTSLLQSLIDIGICYFHSTDKLRSEVSALAPAIEERQTLNKARRYIMDTYGLEEDQAADLLAKNADRQQRPLADLAQRLLDTGSFL